MRVTCSVLSEPAALERLAPAWSELLARSGSNEPMLSPPWLLTWWRTFGPLGGRRLRAAAFYGEGRLVGLLPLLLRRWWYTPGIPFRRLESLGSGEDEADEVCSEYLSLIAERGADEAVASALATALASGALGGWDELVLQAMNGESAMPELLARALRREALCVEVTPAGLAHYIPLPATFDGYLQQLPSSHRYFINRSLRDFERWASGTAELKAASTLEELASARAVLMALHEERWSADGRPGAFASARFEAFHASLMPELLAAGALELLTLTVRGEPIAALYNIVWNGKVYFYQSGRKLQVPRGVRPGVVAHALAIRRAIERGRREYDLLGGTRRYKLQLALATRPIVQLRAARSELLEAARALVERGVDRARRLRGAR